MTNNADAKNKLQKKPQSSRDKILEKKKLEVEANKLSTSNEVWNGVTSELQAQVISADKTISNENLDLLVKIQGGTAQEVEAVTKSLNKKKDDRSRFTNQLVQANKSAINAQVIREQIGAIATSSAAALIQALASGTYDNTTAAASGSLSYNASAVKEAYFSIDPQFTKRVQGPTNTPVRSGQAKSLWTSSSGSKGMIVTSEQVLKAWNSGSNAAQSSYSDRNNYGFQFHYNPGTVSMSYFTSPNVDVTMMTSGAEMFNLAGVSGSQGSVSFQVVINRIMDFQYFTPSGSLRQGFTAKSIYPVEPKTTDLKEIYNKGTMYDVEYLLRVLMGTTMNSYLRGQKTADMGWLPAIPVELHLGKSLRYLGTVNSVNLNHMMFDSRMVPIFTTMDISFARLPDYPPAGTSGGIGGTV